MPSRNRSGGPPTGHAQRAALVLTLTLACAPPGGVPPAPPPAPELVAVLYASTNAAGDITWNPAPAATTTGSAPLVWAIPSAAVLLVLKTDAAITVSGGATFTSEGRQLAQATSGSITQIRRLREADEGYYVVDSTVKSPTDGVLRWYVSVEPPALWREGRVFSLDLQAVTLGGYPGPQTRVYLGFSPPSAPGAVTFAPYQAGNRTRNITWVDNSGDETGFDILVNQEIFLTPQVAGRVGPNVTQFTTGDVDLIGNSRDSWFQVCARGSFPRRCSLPTMATYLPLRRVVAACTSLSGSIDITLTPLTEDPLLYRGYAPDPATGTIPGLPVVAGGLASTLENRSILTYEVRSPDPGYVTLAPGVSTTFPPIEVEGPWTARLPASTNPLPANLVLRIGWCR